jgi:hypothetical protein
MRTHTVVCRTGAGVRTAKTAWHVLVAGCLVIMLLAGCGTPQAGSELSTDERAFLQGQGLLGDNEQVILIANNASFEVGGTFFTDQRLATYWRGERDPEKWYASYPAIYALDFVPAAEMSEAHQIRVRCALSVTKVVYIGGTEGAARQFYQQLRKEWERQRRKPSVIDPPTLTETIPAAESEITRPWPAWKRYSLFAVAGLIALAGLVLLIRIIRSLCSGCFSGAFILYLAGGWIVANIIFIGGIAIVAFVVGFFIMGAGLTGFISLLMTGLLGCVGLVVLNVVALGVLDFWLTRKVRRFRAGQLAGQVVP